MNQEKIGKFIRELRLSKNMTQEELANEIGVTNKAVGNWENGRRLPDYSIVKELCKELDISVNELFNGKREKNNDGLLSALEYENKEKKKYKFKNILIVLISMLIISFNVLFVYFISNFNKVKVYSFYGSNDMFTYSGTFVRSNIKNIYFSGKLIKQLNSSDYEIKRMVLKCDDKVIVGASGELIGTFYEDDGYSEIFSPKVLNNLDKWYIEITYKIGNETKTDTIKLSSELIMKNNKIVPLKAMGIVENPDEKEENPNEDIIMQKFNERVDFLINHGYTETTSESRKELNELSPRTITREFRKVLKDNSFIEIEVERGSAMFWYQGVDYDVHGNLISRYLTFISREVGTDKKLYYIYNARDDLGRCHSKSCPDNFIREARSFFEVYKKEFDGIYYFSDGEHSIYNEDGTIR